MKRFLGISLVLFTLSLLTSTFATTNVNAASDYDYTYRTLDVTADDDSFLVNHTCPSTGRISWNDFITQVMLGEIANVPTNFSDRIYDADTNPDTQVWYVSRTEWSSGQQRINIGIANSSRSLSWETVSGTRVVKINPGINPGWGHMFNVNCSGDVTNGGSFSGTDTISNESNANVNIFNYFIAGPVDFNYPQDYEGESINDEPYNPEDFKNLQPHFNFHINKNGKITWQYLKNISPFLTGEFFTNIDKMNNNWNGLAPEGTIHQVTSNPAGWLDEEWILPGEGYYQFNISHSQQLDSPPWTNQNFHIDQVFLQFYWNGESEVNGTNIGCSSSELCNPFRAEHSDTWNLFSSLDNINTFGLTAFITAPLNFIGTLPNKVNTCEPISFAWLDETITLTCLRDRYQEWSPTVFTIWQTVVSAVVAFSVSYALFRHIKDMNSPDKDGIEVAKL